MMQILVALQPAFGLVGGWVLGLFSPIIAERIRKRSRARDLRQSIRAELHETLIKLILIANHIRTRSGNQPDSWIDWALPILRGYTGPEDIQKTISALEAYSSVPETERRQLPNALSPEAVSGMMHKRMPLTFLETLGSEMCIMPLPDQVNINRIRWHVHLVNEHIDYLNGLFMKTFGASEHDVNVLRRNLSAGYGQLGERAEIAARAIIELES